jgi:Domain of unknown function (DUF4276)
MMKHIGLVVEGRADKSLSHLVRRYLAEQCHTGIRVETAITAKDKGKLLKQGVLEKYVYLAGSAEGAGGVLVIFDSDKDLVCQLGPDTLARVEGRSDVPVKICIAVRNIENWIMASVETTLGEDVDPLPDPEGSGAVHAVKTALKPRAYNKPVHQPGLTEAIDFDIARGRSPSFDRFLRVVDEIATDAISS